MLVHSAFQDPKDTLIFFLHDNRMEKSSIAMDEVIYDQIERWCQTQIKAGSDFFFDPILFRSTLRTKATEWNFPYVVSERPIVE